MFTVLEPTSVLTCACMPLTQYLFKRLATSGLGSKFSLSLTRSSRKSGLSNSNNSQPVRHVETKPGPWTKLDEGLLSSEAKSERRNGNAVPDGDDIYELTPGVSTFKRAKGPIEARDLV